MKHVIVACLMLLPSAAFAADTIPNGTFEGDKPRGSAVSDYAHIQNDAGTNYGQEWASPRAQEGTVDDHVQAHIGPENNVPGSQEVAGYGRNK